METPLVTVICLCYNHERFIEETLASVISQTYTNIEIWVVDDASIDDSKKNIEELSEKYPQINTLFLPENQGNCKAFNQALKMAKGKYIIDLACDDVLLPERIAKQVAFFENAEENVAMVHSNTEIIDENGKHLGFFNPITEEGKATQTIPQGDVYEKIIEKSFISTPSMMFRKSILDELGGYDENLLYEDFDIWVRMARHYHFLYFDEVLTKKRKVGGSLGSKFYQIGNSLVATSLKVCQKILAMNKTQAENKALANRVRFFIRQSFYTHQFGLATGFGEILGKADFIDFLSRIVLFLCKIRFPVNKFYQLYVKLKVRRVSNPSL